MHIVKFKGGLANQMFQLCLYEKLKDQYGKDNVYADVSHYLTNNDHGGFKLDKYYNLNYCEELPKNYSLVDELGFEGTVVQNKRDYLYDGYWQDIRFFPENIDFLREVVELKDLSYDTQKMLLQISSTESVSVHIRRGDYVDSFYHGNIANLTYIYNAINFIKEKIKYPIFFVFSDDIEWCRKNIYIKDAEFYYVVGNEEQVEKDMALMSRCKHNIIANSSFSWWAQQLNKNEDKIVISPEYWFNDKNNKVKLNRDSFIHVKNVPFIYEKAENPKFSIIVSVHNDYYAIRRCLSSILNQLSVFIEIIIVDDASEDGSFELLESYAKDDARIVIIKNNKKRSTFMSRVEAMKIARGKYILFINSMDYYSQDAFEILDSAIAEKKVDIIEFSYIREPSKEICNNQNDYNTNVLQSLLNGNFTKVIWNKCYSNDIVKETIDNLDCFYSDESDGVYFSFLFFFYAKSYARIKDSIYHNITENETQQYSSKDSFTNIVNSLANENEGLRQFVTSNIPQLLESVNAFCDNEVLLVATQCMRSRQSLMRKLSQLDIIAEICWISDLKKYKKKTNWVSMLRESDNFDIKMIIKCIITMLLLQIKKIDRRRIS